VEGVDPRQRRLILVAEAVPRQFVGCVHRDFCLGFHLLPVYLFLFGEKTSFKAYCGKKYYPVEWGVV
jgi:hypothetical protein